MHWLEQFFITTNNISNNIMSDTKMMFQVGKCFEFFFAKFTVQLYIFTNFFFTFLHWIDVVFRNSSYTQFWESEKTKMNTSFQRGRGKLPFLSRILVKPGIPKLLKRFRINSFSSWMPLQPKNRISLNNIKHSKQNLTFLPSRIKTGDFIFIIVIFWGPCKINGYEIGTNVELCITNINNNYPIFGRGNYIGIFPGVDFPTRAIFRQCSGRSWEIKLSVSIGSYSYVWKLKGKILNAFMYH